MLPFQQKTFDVRNCTRLVNFPTKTLMLEIVLDYVTFPTKNIDV